MSMFPDIEDDPTAKFVFGQMLALIAVALVGTGFMVFFLLSEGVEFKSVALLVLSTAATGFAVHFHTKIAEYRNRQD